MSTIDDFPVPNCFYFTVAFLGSKKGLFSSLDKLWWGHRFVPTVDAKTAKVGSDALALGGIADPSTGTKRAREQSNLLKYVEKQYPIRIEVTQFHDRDLYYTKLLQELDQNLNVVLPYPRCTIHGFSKLVDPIDHYVVAQRAQGNDAHFQLLDLFGVSVVSEEQMLSGISWFLDRYGAIPWYDVKNEPSWRFPGPQDPLPFYSSVVEEYESGGRAAFQKYIFLAEKLDTEGRLHQLPSEKLWSLPGCRMAETKFLSANCAEPYYSLLPLLDELANIWRNVLFKARLNSAAGAPRARSLLDDLEKAWMMEEDYMNLVSDITHNGVRVA